MGEVIKNFKIPCFKCKERVVGCHSTCDKYKEWKAREDELKIKSKNTFSKNKTLVCSNAERIQERRKNIYKKRGDRYGFHK